jgi:putative membrane protein
MKLLVRWGALALAFWVATALIPGIDVMGGFTTYLWVALLFAILMLVSRWSDKLEINNFWSAIFAAVVISLVTRIVSGFGKKALPN